MDICSRWRASSAATRRVWMGCILGLSGASTLLGVAALLTFDQTAGAVSTVPVKWPASSSIERTGHANTLLVFVHPFCSCSVATLSELATLGITGHYPSTTVLFYRSKDSNWKPGSLWRKAEREMPGAHLVWDEDGHEAKRFGARTSGYSFLYGPGGELLFKGGVTGSRGHEGDNSGIDRLRASIETGRAAPFASLVFGCALAGADVPLAGGSR
jgi:hypothetical protein